MTATRPVTIKIDQDTCEWTRRLADVHQRPSRGVMREDKRESYRQGGIEAWSAYQANGLHIGSEEADAWLGQLEVGQDMEPPECHV